MAEVDRDANVKVTRSRLMIAIAAGNADALSEVCDSVAADWAAELQSEVAAARKAIELVRGHEAAVKSLDSERAAVLRLRTELAELAEQQRGSAAEMGEADDVINELKEQLSGAELRASGRAPATSAQELSSVQQETRIKQSKCSLCLGAYALKWKHSSLEKVMLFCHMLLLTEDLKARLSREASEHLSSPYATRYLSGTHGGSQ